MKSTIIYFRIAKNYYKDPTKMTKILDLPKVKNLKEKAGIVAEYALNAFAPVAIKSVVSGGVNFLKKNRHSFE